MSINWLLWVLAVAIAVVVGLAKFAQIDVPVVTAILMKDAVYSLFAALALALLSRIL